MERFTAKRVQTESAATLSKRSSCTYTARHPARSSLSQRLPPAFSLKSSQGSATHLQRKCGCGGTTAGDQPCSECATSSSLQSHSGSQAYAPGIVHEVLQSPGQPLDEKTRAFFENRFQQDFSDVRIHTGAQASASAVAVNALAYTVSRDVVFGAGQFAPDTDRGRSLIAHELTHVAQQRQSQPGLTPLSIGPASDHLEKDAERHSDLSRAADATMPVRASSPPPGTLQRVHPALAVAGGAVAFGAGFLGAYGIDYATMTRERAERYARNLQTLYPGWLDALPDCPCTLPCERDTSDWVRDPNPNLQEYHPGAAYSCRSSASATGGSRHGQQCTYSADRRLITDGPGAGTPDVYSPSWGVLNLPYHHVYDVKTWRELGWATYNQFWRPNNDLGCPRLDSRQAAR